MEVDTREFHVKQDPAPLLTTHPGLPSAAIFTFRKEDHTLGNMLRTRLLKTSHVTFAAYKVRPPLVPILIT